MIKINQVNRKPPIMVRYPISVLLELVMRKMPLIILNGYISLKKCLDFLEIYVVFPHLKKDSSKKNK